MLAYVGVVVASFLVTGIAAQSSILPPGFDPTLISANDKFSWCQAELDTCPRICGGGYSKNQCNSVDLTFSCVCPNGTTPNVSAYKNTLPFFICEENRGQCIARHPNDAAGQQTCKDNAKCGTLNATELDAASSSSTTQAASSTSQAAATTTGAPPAATNSSAAMTIQIAQDYSTAILATIFLAIFKFLL